jgi:quinol monooxygenase YgiN
MSQQVVVVATITTSSKDAEAVKAALAEAVGATRKEDGCEQYVLHRDAKNTNVFVMLERWRDEKALSAHTQGAPFTKLAHFLSEKASLAVMKLAEIM